MIRPARASDWPVLEGLDRIIFPGDDRAPLEEEGARWWILWDGDAPVAFGGAAPCDGGTAWELLRAGVVPWARGKGLQRRLVRVRLSAARRAGATRVVTYTAPWNVCSANTLIRCGFRLYVPAAPWGVDGALYWYVRLA